METVYLVTRKGYGIKVDIDADTLETLKKQFAEGDVIESMEEN